ncbi:hypothetical protein J3R83DRAFT_3794 [Lanmaoa asiatica]|nr:hypothetical protein J3R83DRAFT_3794 [Lanmaoa asiatica]
MSSSIFHGINFDKWSTLADGTVVLSKNAAYIPRPVSEDELPFPRADGSWGPQEISLLPQMYDPEHPYMSHIHILVDGHNSFSLPHSIACHRFRDSDFYLYPPLPYRVAPGPYKSPAIAVGRAEVTLFVLSHNIMSYRDAVEYTRGLQRFVAEIHAFLIWGNEFLSRSLTESEPPRQCFRGAYVTSLADFTRLSAYGVPVFYLTGSSASGLPDTRCVRTTELHSLCESRTWADIHVTGHNKDVIKERLVHSKPLMFYPPHVNHSDPLAYERAARGYATREDKQSFDQRLVADSVAFFNRSPQPPLPRKSKAQDSDWRRQAKSIRADWPTWGCDWDYVWHYHAVGDGPPEHTDPNSPIPSHGAHFAYAIPPVHLLSNVQSDEKRARSTVLTTPLVSLPLQITTRPLPPSIFTLRRGGTCYLDYGGGRIDGLPSRTAYYSLSQDLSPRLALGRRLELKDFENKKFCNLVVYNLALTNHKLQFEETDDFVMHIDSMPIQERHTRLEAPQDLFRTSWDIPLQAFPWHDPA